MSENGLKENIGKSLGRIPSGVGILSTKHNGHNGAMLASWIQQVSFEPPMITVAIKKGRPVAEYLMGSKKFALSLLHTGQKDMLAHFGKGFEPGEEPFDGIDTETQVTGALILKHSLCFMECELMNQMDAGDHQVFLGKIVNGGMEEEGQPMVHVRRSGFNY